MNPTPSPAPIPSVGPASGPVSIPAHSLDPSNADWWWQYGLQGIVAGLVGGLMAAGAVWLTLRHERRMVDLTSTRALAAQVAGQTRSMKELASMRTWSPVELAKVREYEQLLQELEARLSRRWLHAAMVIGIALVELEDLLDSDLVSDTNLEFVADGIGKFCREWISDPGYFEDVWYLQVIHWRPYPKGSDTGFERRTRWLLGFGDGDFSAATLEERARRAEED